LQEAEFLITWKAKVENRYTEKTCNQDQFRDTTSDAIYSQSTFQV